MDVQDLPRLKLAQGMNYVLLLSPARVRLLHVQGDRISCVAEGDAGPPADHPVARHLAGVHALGVHASLFVVLWPAEQNFVQEVLPNTGRRVQRLVVRGKLDEYFPYSTVRSGEPLPGNVFAARMFRLTAVTEWPELQPWLAWCCELELPLDGPFTAPLLLAGAAYAFADAASGHRILVVRTHDAGAWLLSVQEGRIRLARYLSPEACGGAEVEPRVAALAEQIERSTAWLAAQDSLPAQAVTVDLLDLPEVLQALSSRLGVPVRPAPLQLGPGTWKAAAEAAGAAADPAAQLGDRAIVAALRQAAKPTRMHTTQWAPRYQAAARTRAVARAAGVLLPLATGAALWFGVSVVQAQSALAATEQRLQDRDKVLAQKRDGQSKRNETISKTTGGQSTEQFENVGKAYRMALAAADDDAAIEHLVRAVGQSVAQGGIAVNRISIAAGAPGKPPRLELAVDVPSSAQRSDSLAVLRELTMKLQTQLKGHTVQVHGLEQFSAPSRGFPGLPEAAAPRRELVVIRVEPRP